MQSSRADGRHYNCKACRSAYFLQKYSKEDRQRKYYSDHNKSKEQRKEYYRRNKEKFYVNKLKRQFITKQATPKWADDFDDFVLSEAYKLCKLRKKATNIDWEIDHIIPLQGKNVCGLHWHQNWQVMPKLLNRKKGNKHDC